LVVVRRYALVRDGGEERDGDGHVAHAVVAPALELDPCELPHAVSYGACYEHLATRSDSGDARGQVHRGTEPVALAGDCWPVMHPDANGGEAMPRHNVMCRRET
jgi:hypothetical protein